VDELLYRACQEALRNVEAHAGARNVDVRVRRAGASALLEVADDGRGLGDDAAAQRANGHMGLQILRDLVRQAGGTLSVEPGERRGTVLRVEVPAR
jgi:signal transduction histidine kinase